jgi:hypothetical protein
LNQAIQVEVLILKTLVGKPWWPFFPNKLYRISFIHIKTKKKCKIFLNQAIQVEVLILKTLVGKPCWPFLPNKLYRISFIHIKISVTQLSSSKLAE